jgi:hypothetical protein
MMITFIGLALGPYTMGQISDTLVAQGSTSAEALTNGMLWGLTAYFFALIALILAALNIEKDERSRLDRARELGETIV